MTRREWVHRHFKPFQLLAPPLAWADEPEGKRQHRLAENRKRRAMAKEDRSVIEPAITKVIEALPTDVWESIRRGRPALYFRMADPPGKLPPEWTNVEGPYKRTYYINIGWDRGNFPHPFFVDADSIEFRAILAHEIGHVAAGHICFGLTLSETEYKDQDLEADQLAVEWGFGNALLSGFRVLMKALRLKIRDAYFDDNRYNRDFLTYLSQRIQALKDQQMDQPIAEITKEW